MPHQPAWQPCQPFRGQTTLSRIPLGSPFSNPSLPGSVRMKMSPFARNATSHGCRHFCTLPFRPLPPSQSSTQHLSPLPILHLHQLPARMEIHHGRRSRPTNGRTAGRRWRRQVAALIPTWRHLLGQGGNFRQKPRFCFCRDSVALCRLPRQLPIPPAVILVTAVCRKF